MNGDLISALRQIERERNIPLDMLKEAVEQALTSSYRKTFGSGPNTRVDIDWESGGVRVISTLKIVPRRVDMEAEISLSTARKKIKKNHIVKIHPMDPALLPHIDGKPIYPEDDELFLGMDVDVVVEENPKNFGRIAAQTTKQVIIQKIREAERDIVFNEYARREGDIISGTVQRNEHRNWVVDLGKVEGIIPPQEQVPTEHFHRGERIKSYVLKVEQGTRGPQVVLSRTHPNLIKRLFETDIPEIAQGLIEIHNVVREPGARSKVSVKAVETNVDPLGACVGPRGSRVQMIVDELRGEKIDIIQYTDDPFTFVSNSLSPARVLTVTLNPDDRTALVIVPEAQYSLAIGKEGQNARLAAKLTNWKIDIKSELFAKELEEKLKKDEEERKIREEAEKKLREEKKLKEETEKQLREEKKKKKEEQKRQRDEEEKKRIEETEEAAAGETEEEIDMEEAAYEEEIPYEDEAPIEEEALYEDEIPLERPVEDQGKTDDIDEYLKEIPKDIPIEQYVTMAFMDEKPVEPVYAGHEKPVGAKVESSDSAQARRKKEKKKKKKRRGQDYDEYY